ncbi:MAG: hypothetical protein QXP41_01870 [Candidatus Nitrosocaldus sp.]
MINILIIGAGGHAKEVFSTIQDTNTFIGVKATIMRVKIGKNCIIGACSLINKDIPDNSKAKGIPATYTPSDGKITFGTR